MALIIHKYKKYLIIKSEVGEEKIDVELLNQINETPENYSVCMETLNDEKGDYLDKLSQLFEEYQLGEKMD